MKLLIAIPALIADQRHVDMIRVQSLLSKRIKARLPNTEIVSSVIYDNVTSPFLDAIKLLEDQFSLSCKLEENSKPWVWGIRNPTTRAIRLARDLGCSHILRIIQDTFIFDIDTFVKDIEGIGKENAIAGHIHHWPTTGHFGYCDQMGIERRCPLTYVHGAVMFAPVEVWEGHYVPLPQSVNHFWEDCLFSQAFLQNGGKLINLTPESWQHNHNCDSDKSNTIYEQFRSDLM